MNWKGQFWIQKDNLEMCSITQLRESCTSGAGAIDKRVTACGHVSKTFMTRTDEG